MTPALTLAETIRADAYHAGLLITHIDDLLSVARRMSQIAHDRAMWQQVMLPELHEIEAALFDYASAALLEGVEALDGSAVGNR